MAVTVVREAPADLDRLAMTVRTPDGWHQRWADDEPDAERIPNDLNVTWSLPGGSADISCQLLRDMSRDRGLDLDNYNEVALYGPGVDKVWRGYLSGSPDTLDSVEPAATGDVGRLKDDPSIRLLGVDRSLERWGETSLDRKINGNVVGGRQMIGDVAAGQAAPDSGDAPGRGQLGVSIHHTRVVNNGYGEAMYDSGGVPLGFLWAEAQTVGIGAGWDMGLQARDDDTWAGAGLEALGAIAAGASSLRKTIAGGNRRTLVVWAGYTGGGGPFDVEAWLHLTQIAVYGRVVPRAASPGGGPDGVLAPDLLKALIDRVGGLRYTADSIAADHFVIPHWAALEPITAEQGILDVNRFFRNIWRIEDGVFRWGPPETFGELWHVRRDRGAQITSNGPDAEQEFNGVIVRYDDPLVGAQVVVGPPGTGLAGPLGLSTEVLRDTDPDLPLNKWGRRRYAVVEAGLTSEAGALRLGQRFMEGIRARAVSGSITIAGGQIRDDLGVGYPAWAPNDGDRLIVDDEPNARERLITEVSYEHPSRTARLTLDSAPDGLEALLERLQVVLVGVVD